MPDATDTDHPSEPAKITETTALPQSRVSRKPRKKLWKDRLATPEIIATFTVSALGLALSYYVFVKNEASTADASEAKCRAATLSLDKAEALLARGEDIVGILNPTSTDEAVYSEVLTLISEAESSCPAAASRCAMVRGLALAARAPETGAASIAHALQLDPISPDVRLASAKFHLGMGNKQAALEQADAAMRLAPSSSRVAANRAMVVFANGEQEAALVEIGRAIALDPGSSYCQLAGACLMMELDRDKEAMEYVSAGLRLNPRSSRLLYMKGRLLHRQDNYDGALGAFEEALWIDRNDADANYYRGVCLEKLGYDEEATKSYKKAAELSSYYEIRLHRIRMTKDAFMNAGPK